MKLTKYILMLTAALAVVGCEDSADDMESGIDLYLQAIPFTDTNLQQCLESEIAAQGITTSKELTQLTCTAPIADVHGLHYFVNLESIDLSTTGMSCSMLHELQIQVIERAGVDEDESIAQIIQPSGCFYNEITFNDPLLKECVGAEVALNGWNSIDEVTFLACEEPTISDTRGLEVFTNLTMLDVSKTAIPCIDIQTLQGVLVDAVISGPVTCNVSAIEFSEPVQLCVDAQAPVSDLVIDFNGALSCNDPAITDLLGLDKLTSLTSLDLSNTSVNCIALSELSTVLKNTDVTKPAHCIVTSETLLSDLVNFSDPAFADDIMQACIDNLGVTTVGEVTAVNCGAPVVLNKELTSIAGLENLVSMTNLTINATKVEDFQALKDHPSLVYLSVFNLKRLNDDDMNFIHNNMTYLTDFNMGGATGMKDYSLFKNMVNLKFLGVANQSLSGEGDLGSIPEMTWLKKLNIKANQLVTVEPLHSLTDLIEVNLTKNPALTCEQIQAFKDALPVENETVFVIDQGCVLE